MTTKRRTRLIQTVIGVSAFSLLVTSTAVAVARETRDEPATAEAVLAEARKFVVDYKTVRFRAEVRQESTFGGFGFSPDEEELVPPEEGTTIVSRSVVEGAASEPDRSRTVTRANGLATETIVVGDDSWWRFAEPGDDLADSKWMATDSWPGGFEEDPGAFSDGLSGFMGIMSSDGSDFGSLIELIDRAVAPTIVSRTGDETVVRAAINPEDGARPGSTELNQGTVEITVADNGRPVRSVLELTQAIGEEDFPEGLPEDFPIPDFHVDSRVAQEYSAWGDSVDIEPPADADIERTPGIDEEAIAEYQDAPLYQPRGIPQGWVLSLAEVIPADESDNGCDQVEIDYFDPVDEYYGYLYLYEMEADCADLTAPPDSEPFTAGPNRGWVESYDGQGAYAQIVVGRTVIQAETDLSVDDLRRVLAQLRSLDLTVEPTPLVGLTSVPGTRS